MSGHSKARLPVWNLPKMFQTNIKNEREIQMSLKITGQSWNCQNACKFNCCSEIFLPMNQKQKDSFEQRRFFIVDNNYTNWVWISFHKSLLVEKLDKGFRKISFFDEQPFRIVFNPYRNCDELYIPDKCSKLMENGKCKIFRARPDICSKALCPVFDLRRSVQFYAEKGLLKDKLEARKRGELK
jgi:hypothetical protein